ncbi:MAG: LysR family transcriptional regulator [Gemmobacter sp.]|nr:LysR family transcriptional regulator [Gemmobacter sp.]
MKPPVFTLRQLAYFVTAAKHGKIANAAVDVGISQSAITTAILELERTLGVSLFDRHAYGVTLTHRGHMFHQHALAVLGAVDEAQRWPFQADSNIAGTLRVVATHVVVGYFMLPYLAKFRSQYPNVDITLVELTRPECEDALLEGQADCAVMLTSNLEDSDRLASTALLKARRQLWVSANSPLLAQKTVSLREVESLPYVFLLVDEGEKVIRTYWKTLGLEPNVVFRTSSMEAMREWIALGQGVTIVADTVYRPWSLEGRRIERVPILETIPPMEIGIVWSKDKVLSDAARGFVDYLAGAVQQFDSQI